MEAHWRWRAVSERAPRCGYGSREARARHERSPTRRNPLSSEVDQVSGEKILVVDDEEGMVQFLSILLTKEGYEVHVATSGRDALQKAEEENFDVVVTDIKMPGEIDGLGVLSGIKKMDPSIPVVIRTAFASQKSAIEALNRGAYQYLEKSAKNDEIRLVIKNAIAMRRVQSENGCLQRQHKRCAHEQGSIRSSRETPENP